MHKSTSYLRAEFSFVHILREDATILSCNKVLENFTTCYATSSCLKFDPDVQ